MTDIMELLNRANDAIKKNKQEKTVSKVEKKGDIFIVEFSGKNGEELFLDQGVVLPASLGFQPEVGMSALYTTESAGAIGDAADLTFMDCNGNKLFSAHKNRGVGPDKWDVTYNKVQEGTTPNISKKIDEVLQKVQHNEADTKSEKDLSGKHAFYYAHNDTVSSTFIRLDKKSGRVDHAFSCSSHTGLFYKNLDKQYGGKTLEDLLKDETLANFCTKKVELNECNAQRFIQVEKMGLDTTYGKGKEL